ncbi:MAG TPA: alpha/beta hydrolase-fold protein [Thermoanaerobaculia bacterium]|nr:alpha/beta hydrolase-fold protein [Thermoanaerobaculia bacterium]
MVQQSPVQILWGSWRRSTFLFCLAGVVLPLACPHRPAGPSPLRFEVVLPAGLRGPAAGPVDGRVILILSGDPGAEPRFQVAAEGESQQLFGVDVAALPPGGSAVIDGWTLGYPAPGLAEVPAGRYRVQAVLHLYATFRRADGRVVQLHADHGEGQQWNRSPGNLFSAPVEVEVDPGKPGTIRVELTQEIPPLPAPRDSRWVRHLRIASPLLSRFWGRPVELGAVVLLPAGYDEHPQARYPVVYYHDHFAPTFPVADESERPPGPAIPPRLLVVLPQTANPYYDDAYAVNSENLGPYGDALVQELLPAVERQFRAIGEPWARAVYGSSTGGWAALAQQVFHPDLYNGAWVNCPDPVDFRAFLTTDLYRDTNVYWEEGRFGRSARPESRAPGGGVTATMEEANRYERVLGSRGRSGEQFDAWQAVWSPVGEDGYPRPIFDKATGAIDPRVAAFWRERYDLTHILARDWQCLGPRLQGKLHVKVGDSDTYYLDRAVRFLDQFLKSTREPGHGPWFAGDVEFGRGEPHCWTGDPFLPNTLSRPAIERRLLPKIAQQMLKTAPQGADVTSWRY